MSLALHYWMRGAHHCSAPPPSPKWPIQRRCAIMRYINLHLHYMTSSGTLNSTIPYRTYRKKLSTLWSWFPVVRELEPLRRSGTVYDALWKQYRSWPACRSELPSFRWETNHTHAVHGIYRHCVECDVKLYCTVPCRIYPAASEADSEVRQRLDARR